MNQNLFEQTDHYISQLLAPEDEALANAMTRMQEEDIPAISVSANQGKFLHILALMNNARTILELGTLGGYSTIWLARALPEGGRLITLESEPRHAAVALENIAYAGLEDMVDLRLGKAIDILPQLEEEQAGPFDFIFIDADKPPYVEYFEWALKLSRPGTVIVADNVIRNGKVMDDQSEDERVQGAKRFNEMLGACTGVTATILPTVGVKEFDGMAIAIVK